MVAYLSQSGAVLGFNGGPISLKVLYATGSLQSLTGNTGDFMYDRIYTASAQAPFQVNPFAVEDGNAPDPAVWPPSPISYSLAAWDGYIFSHWDSSRAKSTSFNCTAVGTTTANFSWTRATGYTRNTGELFQKLYVQECDTDPFNACGNCGDAQASSSSPTFSYLPGDATTDQATGLTEGYCYVATVTTLWDERGTNSNYRESDTADSLSSPSNGTNNNNDQIFFQTSWASCDAVSTQAGQGTTGFNACSDTPNLGTIYSPDSSTFAGLQFGDRLFTNATCTTGLVSDDFISDGTDNTYVDTDGVGSVTAAPQSCGGI